MDIESKVKRAITTVLGLEGQVFSVDDKFVDLGADSLDAVEVIMAIEDEFGIEISDEEAQACVTTKAVIDLVAQKTN
jgi:acyl carrier protein